MELNEKQFIKGFNNGYLLAKYEFYSIAHLLINIRSINSYVDGIKYGVEEFQMEQKREHIASLKFIRDKSKQENRDKER